jgi:RIO kinase 1
MARNLTKRKQPDVWEKQIHERIKVESEVFDKPTLISLSHMMKKGMFNTLDFPISKGKEANVFRAKTDTGYLAVKIYRIETGTFIRIHAYIQGDPRFTGISKAHRDTIFAWARKEYGNLEICSQAGIHAPRPVFYDRNILVMEFLGYEGEPYPTLKENGPMDAENDLKSILADVKKLYKHGIVHSDLSEYNIMMTPEGPYFIDVGQAVVLRHPRAQEFLERDMGVILAYFEKFGVKKDKEKVLAWIRG